MRRTAIGGLGFVALLVLAPVAVRAQGSERNRVVRVGNTNLVLFGAGFTSFDHPNFQDDVGPSLSYARRVLRRESRVVPIWLRGGIGFLSEDRDLTNSFTVWNETDPGPFREDVHEHMSDFAVRAEVMADLFHRANGAVSGSVGFAVHALSFSSDGVDSRIPIFTTSSNELAPTASVGARFFTAKRPYTVYGEARWGKAYGRTDLPTTPPKLWLTDQTFEFTSVSAWTFEVGFGMHW